MQSENAAKRARLSGKATDILNKRTLENAHKRLFELIKPGMTILDLGCGTGAITKDIAELVGPLGRVVGIDNNPALIKEARENYAHITNLEFSTGSIYEIKYEGLFDIVTCARVLQWLDNPAQAIEVMKIAAKENGRILILDYNHEKITWDPAPPEEMMHFYKQFLKWRADAGMDNRIADKLASFFTAAGLTNITVSEQHETAEKVPDKMAGFLIWADVAASRGLQMVEDGYLTETERENAELLFRKWIDDLAISQTMYLLAVEGVKS